MPMFLAGIAVISNTTLSLSVSIEDSSSQLNSAFILSKYSINDVTNIL